MKRSWWLIPCLIVVLALGAIGCTGMPIWEERGESSQGVASLPQQPNTGIWVIGQGEAMAVPDIAELRFGVEAEAGTVAKAQAQAKEAMGKVVQVLEDNGVAEKDIQTQRFSIYPVTRWIERKNEEEIVGYRVANMIIARIREIDKAGDVIDALVEAAGDFVRVQGISFSVDDPTPYYEEARAKAVEDARDKASQLAELAGVTLGKPTYISEGTVYRPEFPRAFAEVGAAPPPETPIIPGELKITLNVQIAYAIA